MTEVSKNSRITFKVRDVSIDGNAVGVCDQTGMTVFCFGADVGENVAGTVIKKTSSYLVARPGSRAASENCPTTRRSAELKSCCSILLAANGSANNNNFFQMLPCTISIFLFMLLFYHKKNTKKWKECIKNMIFLQGIRKY